MNTISWTHQMKNMRNSSNEWQTNQNIIKQNMRRLLKWFVELYPECRSYYRPFGIGYEIYVRVSILYTTRGDTFFILFKGHNIHHFTIHAYLSTQGPQHASFHNTCIYYLFKGHNHASYIILSNQGPQHALLHKNHANESP